MTKSNSAVIHLEYDLRFTTYVHAPLRMQCLLEQKAEVNMATADDNFAPAHEAARAGQLDCLKLLRSLFKRNSTISYSDLHALANALFDYDDYGHDYAIFHNC